MSGLSRWWKVADDMFMSFNPALDVVYEDGWWWVYQDVFERVGGPFGESHEAINFADRFAAA